MVLKKLNTNRKRKKKVCALTRVSTVGGRDAVPQQRDARASAHNARGYSPHRKNYGFISAANGGLVAPLVYRSHIGIVYRRARFNSAEGLNMSNFGFTLSRRQKMGIFFKKIKIIFKFNLQKLAFKINKYLCNKSL